MLKRYLNLRVFLLFFFFLHLSVLIWRFMLFFCIECKRRRKKNCACHSFAFIKMIWKGILDFGFEIKKIKKPVCLTKCRLNCSMTLCRYCNLIREWRAVTPLLQFVFDTFLTTCICVYLIAVEMSKKKN